MSQLDQLLQLMEENINLQVENELLKLKALPLGRLIDKLERIENKSKVVYANYLNNVKVGLFDPHSYRGFYRMLSLDINYDEIESQVDLLLFQLKNAVGEEFEGYKGGAYRMDKNSWVFVSPYGMASQQIIVDVVEHENDVEIVCKTHSSY